MHTHSIFPMKIWTSVSHDHKDQLPCFNTNSIVKMAKSCFKSLVFSSPALLLWFYLLYFWQSLHLSLLFIFIFEMLRNRSDSEADFFWPHWIHGGLLTVWVSSPTFLIFSSSCCLASLAVCSSLILSSSSSCSACCFSRSSLRFCRASRCGAGLPWRSRVTQFWTAETWISHKKSLVLELPVSCFGFSKALYELPLFSWRTVLHASVISAAMLSGAIQPWKDHSRQTGPGWEVTVRRPSFNLWGLAGHSLKALHELALLWDHHQQ